MMSYVGLYVSRFLYKLGAGMNYTVVVVNAPIRKKTFYKSTVGYC